MKDEIERRFGHNLGRVKSLMEAYARALPGGSGRPAVATTDILRSSVVFLHASLEDLLRSVSAWKLPGAEPKHLEDVPLLGKKPRSTYTLADIAAFRGKTVEEVIAESASAWLERSNYNNATEVASALGRCGLPPDEIKKVHDDHAVDLEAMMKRRHWIVHQADRNAAKGQGQFKARSLDPATVGAWLASVEAFGRAVLALL